MRCGGDRGTGLRPARPAPRSPLRHASRGGVRGSLGRLGPLLQDTQVRLHPAGQRGPTKAHEDPRPAIERFERGGVDDLGATGDRLESPAPLTVEAGRGDPHAEARVWTGLKALHLRGVAQQAEPRASRAGSGVHEDPSLDRAVVGVTGSVAAPTVRTAARAHSHPHPPIGCQTVFISRKAAIHSGRSVAASSSQSKRPSSTVVGRRDRRLMSSAASVSTSVRISSATPQVSRASTSSWAARTGTSSFLSPVKTLTTPPGTSDVASTSVRVTAGSGRRSLAISTTAFPVTSGGASRLTRPRSDDVSGATTPTTPVGSGIVKLKYGAATGLDEPSTWPILSAQPAYQTQRSMARSTLARAAAGRSPSAASTSLVNCSRRPSISSATR